MSLLSNLSAFKGKGSNLSALRGKGLNSWLFLTKATIFWLCVFKPAGFYFFYILTLFSKSIYKLESIMSASS